MYFIEPARLRSASFGAAAFVLRFITGEAQPRQRSFNLDCGPVRATHFIIQRTMLYTLSQLMEIMLVERAQGLPLYPAEKPVVEVARTLFRVSGPPLEPDDTETLLRQIASTDESREFQASRMLSCYHHVQGKALFNVLAFKEHDQIRLEIRAVR